MDARSTKRPAAPQRLGVPAGSHFACKFALSAVVLASLGANYRTENFIITAPTPTMAEQIGRAAEDFRRDLAVEWLGKEMPTWAEPCPIVAKVGDRLGAGGATSFLFERGEVYGWRMNIQGSLARILDSVLPHEVTHTIFATHFRRPLPRWADEGACTTVEHESERAKQQTMLVSFLKTERGIPFNRMFAMKEYPRDVMPLYSQGYSLARYLIAQGGRRKFIAYLGDGMRDENWTRATRANYGHETLGHLQFAWLEWVRQGSPRLAPAGQKDEQTLAAADTRDPEKSGVIFRGQSQDEPQQPSVYLDRARRDTAREHMPRTPAPSGATWHAAAEPTPKPVAPERPDSDAVMEPPADETAMGPVPPEEEAAPERALSPPSQRVIFEWSRPPGDLPRKAGGVYAK